MKKKETKSSYKNATIITTHINADFDGIASLLAAQKLYPGSFVVFPGAHETTSKSFFVNSMAYLYNMANIDELDLSLVSRLVLVDTKRKERIGKLAELLDKKNIDIHVYDHHPSSESDIQPNMEIHEPTGATVTILTHILKEKGIDISSEEATVMCLGIYEDTGSFTFSSTTEKDLTATAFLLSKGANLNIVSDMISREITPGQVLILNDMIRSASYYRIGGVEVVVTSTSTEEFIPDFAFLVHKMLKMESLSAIFSIVRMGSKIYIIARSRIPEVDVAEILKPMGGGGHAFAASATIRDKTLAQTESLLIDMLYKTIRSIRQAKDIMSSPAITIAPSVTCKHAGQSMTRYNVNALLVTDTIKNKQTLLGFISRQVIEKALYHNLGDVPVEEYMSSELATVSTTADISEIQEKIIGNKQRILPVVNNDIIKGVVTRTDLLNILVSQNRDSNLEKPIPFSKPLNARTRNIKKLMEERIPKHLIEILRSIGKTASEIGCTAYVIGGFVRDLFLYRTNEDVDIVIEGDGIDFAKKYAETENVRIHTHDKFGTAVIIFPNAFKIDVASARTEYYKFPAALPIVEMSSIKLDLFRRDFTINTLAIQLTPDKFGMLIDFFSAQRDIKEKVIRILHNMSFVEDPTRAFRAIRFEQRFGFTIGKLTSDLIKNAVKMDFFSRLSGKRVFTELRLILEEENPVPAFIRLSDYNLIPFIHPSIKITKHLVRLLHSVKKVLSWFDLLFLEESYNKWTVYFLALISRCDMETSVEICSRFELKPDLLKLFSKERLEAENCLYRLKKKLPGDNSRLYKELVVFDTLLLLYIMAAAGNEKVEKAVSFYITNLRGVNISIQGKDLIDLGMEPGPMFKKIMDDVLEAKLNGKVKTKKDELDFAKKLITN